VLVAIGIALQDEGENPTPKIPNTIYLKKIMTFND
jgi:hypothetical protein